jgi:hypothetical protein
MVKPPIDGCGRDGTPPALYLTVKPPYGDLHRRGAEV